MVDRNMATEAEHVLEGLGQGLAGDSWCFQNTPKEGNSLMQGRHDFFFPFNLITKYTISSKSNATIQYTSLCQDPFDDNKNYKARHLTILFRGRRVGFGWNFSSIMFICVSWLRIFSCLQVSLLPPSYFLPIVNHLEKLKELHFLIKV